MRQLGPAALATVGRAGRVLWLLPALLLLAAPSPARGADNPRLVDLTAERREDGSYAASFRLEGALTQNILDEIDSGLPVTFQYRVEVFRRRRLWTDVLVRREVEVTVEQDSLTRQYRLTRKVDGTVVDSSASEKPEDMRRWMTEIQSLDLGSVPEDDSGGSAEFVRARCRVSSGFFMFFFPVSKKTGWARVSLPATAANDG